MSATDEGSRERVTEYPWTELTAEVVEYSDEPAACTIYPEDVSSEAALTTWISARGDSFVDLSEMR